MVIYSTNVLATPVIIVLYFSLFCEFYLQTVILETLLSRPTLGRELLGLIINVEIYEVRRDIVLMMTVIFKKVLLG